MKLLILGGTKFLGRHLVDAARARSHEVTLFNRGSTAPDLFPDLEQIHGDRDGGLGALAGRTWDAVVDTSGYIPRLVGDSAKALADHCGYYSFISSISVYDQRVPGLDEMGPLMQLADPTVEEITGETYGGLKALCEQAAEAAMPGRVAQIRAGMIVGAYDPTDRFTFWVRRMAAGGRVPVPAPAQRPVQLVHARDLADWVVALAEQKRPGCFNATGPYEPFTFADMMRIMVQVSGSGAQVEWVPDQVFLDQGLGYWLDLPFVIAAEDADILSVNTDRARLSGLQHRPFAEIVRDVMDWDGTRDSGLPLKAGFGAEVEATCLAVWDAKLQEQE